MKRNYKAEIAKRAEPNRSPQHQIIFKMLIRTLATLEPMPPSKNDSKAYEASVRINQAIKLLKEAVGYVV